jgi:hypothetical protein
MHDGTKMIKYPALAIAAILLLSFGMASSASATNDGKVRYVDTVHMQGGVTIQPEDLAFLLESGLEIPEDILIQLASIDEIHIEVDGLAHINLMITEKKNMVDVHLQAFYHGTICITAEGLPSITLDFKNAQLMLHVSLACGSDLDLNTNLHMNGEMTIGDNAESISLDLNVHIKIVIHDSELKNLRISVPEWVDLLLSEA